MLGIAGSETLGHPRVPKLRAMNRPSHNGSYGARLGQLLWSDLKDRWRGNAARANARWGYLKPPGDRGPLVWLRTGADRYSVAYGAGLLAAIRDHRLDVRLVQTFEAEHPDLLALHLRTVQRRAGAGFGPCSHPKALRRAVARLAPLGLLSIGRMPEPALAVAVAERGGRLVVLAADPGHEPVTPPVEAAYPATAAQAALWADRAAYVAPPADPTSLLAPADAKPTLRQLVRRREPLRLWWYHGADAGQLGELGRAFRESELARDGVLFVSGSTPEALRNVDDISVVSLSSWERDPLPAGSMVGVDDFRWLATLGVSVDGTHLAIIDPEALWVALTGAGSLSTAAPEDLRARLARSESADWITTAKRADAVLADWQRQVQATAPHQGELNRRALWAERRQASVMIDELLSRIYGW